MKKLILYSTPGCHLCEQAKALIVPVLQNSPYELEEVDIADSDALMARYGLTIPVLSDSTDNRELRWPFSSAMVQNWLGKT